MGYILKNSRHLQTFKSLQRTPTILRNIHRLPEIDDFFMEMTGRTKVIIGGISAIASMPHSTIEESVTDIGTTSTVVSNVSSVSEDNTSHEVSIPESEKETYENSDTS
jgi:hypothetical protein